MDKRIVAVYNPFQYSLRLAEAVIPPRAVRGTEWETRLYVRDVAGNPVAVSGWSFSMKVKKDRYAADTDPDTATASVYTPDAARGEVLFRFPASTTSGLSVGGYWVEVQATFPDDPSVGGNKTVSLLETTMYVEEAV